MFIQARLFLHVVFQSADYIVLFHLLSHCPHVPQQVLSNNHASESVFFLSIEHFLVLHLELHLAVLTECVAQDPFDLLPEIFAGAWHLGVFYVVCDEHFLRLAQLCDFYRLDGLRLVDANHHISLTHWEVAWLDVEYLQLDAHVVEKRDETESYAFERRRPAHISPSMNLNLLCIAESGDDWHQALHHECATGRSCSQYFLGVQELGVEINLTVAHLGHFFNKCTEDGSELIINARIWPVLANSYHPELPVEEQAERE